MQINFSIKVEKRHLAFLVVLICVLFVVGVSAYVNPITHVGHDANETGPGTFGGDANSLYSFPGNLNVNNFLTSKEVIAANAITLNGTRRTSWPKVFTQTGQVTEWSPISVPAGFVREDCSLLVSIEDAHTDWPESLEPQYTDLFGDLPWADNHYAGAQAYYYNVDPPNWYGWQVRCKYGFARWDAGPSGNDANYKPSWIAAKCRYLLICTK